MKSILVIGLGRFGNHLCRKLVELDNEVMVVDMQEEAVEDVLPLVTSAKIADCTNVEVLRSLGINNFDICFVCIGNNFQNSLEITNLLKELGAKYVISKANRDIQAKFLLKNGADEVIYPNRDLAERLAVRCSMKNVFDYIELNEGYTICEIPPLGKWIGKTIAEVNFRSRYHVSILGTKSEGKLSMLPAADHVFRADEHLMVIGRKEDIDKILKTL